MGRKKLIIIVIILVILGLVAFIVVKNQKGNTNPDAENLTEYTPEEEISTEQLRETILTLYFLDKNTQNLKTEGKLIDSSNLLENPYKLIVQYLIDGPNSENLQKVFPENTRIIEASFNNHCVTLNFSEELLNYQDDTQKYNIINSILNSLTQLTEVNSIKILINGETNPDLNEEYSAIY